MKKQVAITQHHKSSCYTENGGSGVTLLLEKGDQVYIVLQKDTRIWDNSNFSLFSGFSYQCHVNKTRPEKNKHNSYANEFKG